MDNERDYLLVNPPNPRVLVPVKKVFFGNVSAKELAVEKKRYRKECRMLIEQARAKNRSRAVAWAKRRIKFLQQCQSTSAAQRPRELRTCVYLMWCPTNAVYKIGCTDYLEQRINQLRELDPQIECRTSYRTPVLLRVMEKLLHHHFWHFHFPSAQSKELFKLPQEEADGFESTTGIIEQHLLAVEVLRVKALLSKFKAELREADLVPVR